MSSANQEMDRLVQRVGKVRPSVGVAQRVLRLLENREYEVHDVVSLLETDPALTIQILKLVNSSYFGLPQRIASVQHAVCCLGSHTLRLCLLNYGVLQCLSSGLPEARREAFLRHSLTVAIVADKLVRFRGTGNPDEAYCAGLIVDVGALALAQAIPEQYEPLLAQHVMGSELIAAEVATLGFDHAQFGARLLSAWGLRADVCAAVERHHLSAYDESTLVVAVQAAELVAHTLWHPHGTSLLPAQSLIASYFGLDCDDFIQLAIDCKQWLASHADTMSVYLSEEIDTNGLRQRAMEMFVNESVEAAVELDGVTSLIDGLPPLP